MGYTTSFDGQLKFDKPLQPAQVAYITKFGEVRHMNRDPKKASKMPDPIRQAAGLPIGIGAGFFVGGRGMAGQDNDVSILDYNDPPQGQPGLWCQWTVNGAGTYLLWDGGEKFYNYVEWLQYLIDCFFIPWGYTLNGRIIWNGEKTSDIGTIIVEDNVITVKKGVHEKEIDASKIATDVQLITLNVIEIPNTDDMVMNVHSFTDGNPKGTVEAEKLFERLMLKNGGDKSEVEDRITDGYYRDGTYYLAIVHSTPPE